MFVFSSFHFQFKKTYTKYVKRKTKQNKTKFSYSIFENVLHTPNDENDEKIEKYLFIFFLFVLVRKNIERKKIYLRQRFANEKKNIFHKYLFCFKRKKSRLKRILNSKFDELFCDTNQEKKLEAKTKKLKCV